MSMRANQAQTLENLIENLDHRGILVFQVLLGQQCMKLLSQQKVKEVLNAKGIPDSETRKEDEGHRKTETINKIEVG